MEEKKKKRGPKPKADEDLRKHPVTCRLTDQEAEHVDRLRGSSMTRGEWIRTAALKRPPRIVPELNREAWVALARSAANLNQIAYRINTGALPELEKIRAELARFRFALIGAEEEKQ